MTMKDFFPTPPELIERLLEGVSLHNKNEIIDPSAGKADICDFIKAKLEKGIYIDGEYYGGGRRHDFTMDVIEIEPDLQMILKGKGYNLIHDDFLTFKSQKVYDLIVANFPFSEGEHHLQKALSMILTNGGTLRCIVNAETIRNPYTKTRQWCVDRINDLCGEIEFIRDGFKDAERKTGTDVCIVKIEIEKETIESFILTELQAAAEIEMQETEFQAVVETDFFSQIVSSFNMEVDAGIRFLKEYHALKPFFVDRIKRPGTSDYSSPIITLEIGGKGYHGDSLQKHVNRFIRQVRKKYWDIFVHDPRFTDKYTSNILEDLHKMLGELESKDFSIFNLSELEKMLNERVSRGIHESILKMFDEFSRQFSYSNNPYEKNTHYYNGWKSNKAYKIAEKIVLPINGISSYGYGGRRNLDNHYIQSKLADMVKVFNYLKSQDECRMNPYQLVGSQIQMADQRGDYNLDLRYFTIVFYKKGTCHIKFTNKMLLDKLNIYGAQRKAWLPPSYGKEAYSEMDAESRAVVDEFQGKEEYDKVFENRDFYLVETKVLQLTGSL